VHVERKDAAQRRQRGGQPAGMHEVVAHLRSHGAIVLRQGQPGTAAGRPARAMALSFTGRLISAANTPSAIAMYQTMS